MGLFAFSCPACGRVVRRVLAKAPAAPKCPDCGNQTARTHQAPTSRNVESLDNGLMVRSLEREVDAEELFRERAEKDTKERG